MAPPDEILADWTILTDHKVTPFGNLEFVRDISVDYLTSIEFTAASKASGKRLRGNLTLRDYFWFCYTFIKQDDPTFASCISEDNLVKTRRLESALRDYQSSVFTLDNVTTRILFRIGYTTLLGEQKYTHLSIGQNGVSKSLILEQQFADAEALFKKGFFSISSEPSKVTAYVATLMEPLILKVDEPRKEN